MHAERSRVWLGSTKVTPLLFLNSGIRRREVWNDFFFLACACSPNSRVSLELHINFSRFWFTTSLWVAHRGCSVIFRILSSLKQFYMDQSFWYLTLHKPVNLNNRFKMAEEPTYLCTLCAWFSVGFGVQLLFPHFLSTHILLWLIL